MCCVSLCLQTRCPCIPHAQAGTCHRAHTQHLLAGKKNCPANHPCPDTVSPLQSSPLLWEEVTSLSLAGLPTGMWPCLLLLVGPCAISLHLPTFLDALLAPRPLPLPPLPSSVLLSLSGKVNHYSFSEAFSGHIFVGQPTL